MARQTEEGLVYSAEEVGKLRDRIALLEAEHGAARERAVRRRAKSDKRTHEEGCYTRHLDCAQEHIRELRKKLARLKQQLRIFNRIHAGRGTGRDFRIAHLEAKIERDEAHHYRIEELLERALNGHDLDQVRKDYEAEQARRNG